MLRRHLGLVRAWSAAGLMAVSCLASPATAAEPDGPVPGDLAVAETVGILDAQKAGSIELSVRGQGQDKVKIAIRNRSPRRLNVVLPPGLVASSATGQAGGFQSMGLGVPTSRPGSFGQFAGQGAGFRSVGVDAPAGKADGIAVGGGQQVEFTVPAVCLNFGIPTPTPRDEFRLMAVEDYTADPRARRALRSLATLGTSQGVAQAAAWAVFNGMSEAQMAAQAARYINLHEIGLASRFVRALDSSGSGEVMDVNYINQARILVRVHGAGVLAKDAQRLARELEEQTVLGLPVRVVDELPSPTADRAALFLNVSLSGSSAAGTKGRMTVRHNPVTGGWVTLGEPTVAAPVASADLDGSRLAKAIEASLVNAFVSTKVVRRSNVGTTLRIDNRLPFTIAHATVRTGRSEGGDRVRLDGIGVGPGRSTVASIPAASGEVDGVTLNGL